MKKCYSVYKIHCMTVSCTASTRPSCVFNPNSFALGRRKHSRSWNTLYTPNINYELFNNVVKNIILPYSSITGTQVKTSTKHGRSSRRPYDRHWHCLSCKHLGLVSPVLPPVLLPLCSRPTFTKSVSINFKCIVLLHLNPTPRNTRWPN